MATPMGNTGTGNAGGTGNAAATGNALWNDAKETARSKLSEQQKAAAGSLGDFAGALRKSAEQMQQGGQHASAARFAQTAASGLEQLSGALKNRDLETMLRDAEGFARRQPVAFFGAAVFAGFLAVRFLKSSNSNSTSSSALTSSSPMNPGTEI
ncbi:MAG TPA: hypothetical protein VHG88_13065 [Burkholderiales bacterium]|nr:hypothetical protein [Burkholderiales bacterium]